MMQRAAVLIGVNKTGNAPKLKAATDGVRAMEAWALSQGMKPELVKVLTDEGGPVDVQRIKQAIKEIVELTTVEQLILYFAGHGVNIRYGEYWLLSDAPYDPQAAVNVEGSVVLARQSGIPHVVIISDACRTAAEGIQAQYVTGSEVFPNEGNTGPERSVDLFFACTLGKPALEVKSPADAAARFKAVYTTALIEVLEGDHQEVVEKDGGSLYVRPWPVKRFLPALVTERLSEMGVQLEVNQTPDARITSDPTVWLSQLPAPAGLESRQPASFEVELQRDDDGSIENQIDRPGTDAGRSGNRVGRNRVRGNSVRVDRVTSGTEVLGRKPDRRRGGEGIAPPATLLTASQRLLRRAMTGPPLPSAPQAYGGEGEAELLAVQVEHAARPFGPANFETGCGFRVRGARIREAFSRPTQAKLLLDAAGDVLRVGQAGSPAADVLLSFDNGTGAVLPAITGFIASLTFDQGELANVSYEPAERSHRWYDYQARIEELRGLRAVIAGSAQLGVFRLEGDDAMTLARRMQLAKGVDPTMALYAAYAYSDLGRRKLLDQMQDYLESDLQLRFFDIALLTRNLDDKRAGSVAKVFPFVPLLAQGWALLSAHRISFPAALAGLERHLVQSLWTLFDAEGLERIRAAMIDQEVI